MKVTVNVDCTPEEARTFLGLPDVSKLQDAFLNEMRKSLETAANSGNFQELMSFWMPGGAQGWQDMQKAFWDAALSKSKDEDA
jgi:hypothetical protein